MTDEITKDMLIADLVGKHPEAISVLREAGMHCIGCALAAGETLEAGALAHGIDINELIKRLNQAIERS